MTEPEEEDGGGLGRGLARFGVRACPFVWVARARGRWRFVLLAAECLAAAAFGALLWRAVSLRNVPDVGEPPTAPAYGPPEAGSNAYALYAEAMSAYKWKLGPSGASRASLTPGRVRTAEPGVRALLEANREALDLFYQAADRPDAAPTKGLRTKSGATPEMSRLPDLAWLAVEDAAAAEAAGDLDAAWRGYRAVLRAGRHVARRGDLFDRQFGGTCRSWVLARLTRWAALPENTPKRLRQALDDVLALDAIAPDDEYTLRTIYERTRSALDQPDGPFGAGRNDGYYAFKGIELPGEFGRRTLRFQRSLYREPERSRRALRLAFANWLAWASLPPSARPRPAVGLVLGFGRARQRIDFFGFAPGSPVPPAARALDPQDLARAFADAREAAVVSSWSWNMLASDIRRARRDQGALVLTLAEALYLRERGTPPPTPESLVGPYLKALPEDDSASLDDGAIPVINAEIMP